MATVLDVGLLQHFEPVFAFLLVFAIVYALLNFTNILKASQGIYAIIAFVLAMLVLFIPIVSKIITNMAPWFVLIFIFIIFLIMAYKLFGISDDDITATIKAQGGIKWTIIIVALIIFVGALSNAYGPGLLSGSSSGAAGNVTASAESAASEAAGVASGDFGTNVRVTFFHPKVIGILFILLLATAAVGLLGGKSK